MTCGYNDITKPRAVVPDPDPLHYRFEVTDEDVFAGGEEDFTKQVTLARDKGVQIFSQAQMGPPEFDLSGASRDFGIAILVDGTLLFDDIGPGRTNIARVTQGENEPVSAMALHVFGVKNLSAGTHSFGVRVFNFDAGSDLGVRHVVIEMIAGVNIMLNEVTA